jgi:multidrug efflux pump subunit AcrA (membrane-fusion protein)
MPDAHSESTSGVPSPDAGDKIDRIREILLGGSLDEVGARLGQLEARLQSTDTSLREEIERHYALLDASLTGHRQERVSVEAELNRKLTDEVGALRKELARVRAEVQSSVEAALAQLDAKKVDNAALARLLSDVSSRLAGEEMTHPTESGPNG